MQRFTIPAFFALIVVFLISCKEPSESKNIPPAKTTYLPESRADSALHLLILACAEDFGRQSSEVEIRDTRFGYKVLPADERLFVLCGRFRSRVQEKWTKWTPYLTIKTDPYEQWLGSQALPFCQDSTMVWDNSKDLAPVIQMKLDSMRK